MPTRAGIVALALAAATLYAGLHWGSTTAGGADSYGYVSEAGLFLQRQLTIREEIIGRSPWPNAADTWAPLGYRASPHAADAIVPLYAPGLPIMMAVAQRLAGFCAAFVIVPLCGALTVWLTYLLGQRLFGRSLISASAAALVATSPIFLYQLMNPMSDVPATAMWTAAIVLSTGGWPAAAGLAAGGALIIRPNLAAVAVALLLWLTVTRRRPLRFLAGLVPFAVAIGAINSTLYESATISGYGTLDELYAWKFWWPNVRQFVSWTMTTQTPVVGLAVLFVIVPRWFPASRVPYPRTLVVATAAAVKLSYLFYLPFDAWWYLRFLLPIWPLMMVLAVAGIGAIAERLSRSAAPALVVTLSIALALNGVRIAAERFAFDVGRAERRYIDVARFVQTHTERDAVVLALQHSGTIRLYAGRLTLRFDQLDPQWFDRAIDFLARSGRHPYVVIEAGERSLFAARFAQAGRRLVERAPMARLDGADVSIYDAVNPTNASPLAIASSASRRTGWRCDLPDVWPPPVRLD